MKEFEYQGGGKVNGAVLKAYLSAFGPYQKRGEQVLCKYFGVDELVGSPDAWYPLEAFFKALAEFQKQFGRDFMRKIGQGIFANAVFPPGIDSLEKAMAMINEAYYMNHQVEPGSIGGYVWKQESPTRGTMACDNPYPCSFDLGILEIIAQNFSPSAKVSHVEGSTCRQNGDDECTYLIEWEG